MVHQWEPQQKLEPPLALELIQEQFPHLFPKRIRLLGAGWDNTAFVVNEDLIFRFPRREIALPLLEAEWCALPKLAPRLSLPVPLPEWRGIPTTRFPWPFIGYKMLEGTTACHANLSEEERDSLAEPIALFLRDLHATPRELLENCSIPGDNRSRIDWKVIVPKVRKNIEEMTKLNLFENRDFLDSLVNSLQDLREPVSSVVVHGDFYVRHLLINQAHHLSGIIDWGDIHLGDPAIDLAIAHSFLPQKAHKKFRNIYGIISQDTWSLAQLRAIYSSSLLVLYGHHSNDLAILREGLRSLKVMVNK